MAAPLKNRQWTLVRRPKGNIDIAQDFKLQEEEIRELKDGEVLAKSHYLSFDPAQRTWMNEGGSYTSAIGLGEVVRALGVGEVVESKHDGFKKGDLVSGLFGWQEYLLGEAKGLNKLFPGMSPVVALGPCGIVGLTAYFGLLRVGEFKPGDVVVVSGAAGATGSLVGQIAKLKGAKKVIGIAGGAEKVKLLKEELGYDEAIDYKSENVAARLKELVPNEINVYFDNVGGEILEAALAQIAQNARVVLCGGISQYNAEDSVVGPRNYLNLVTRRGRMEGFIVTDYIQDFPTGVKDLFQWVQEGKLKYKTDLQEGFENIPTTFLRLFSGANNGKQLLKL